jgi:microcystin-dependent protein
VSQIPAHGHALQASTQNALSAQPTNQMLSQPTTIDAYRVAVPNANLAPTSIGSVGGSQPHDNRQPFLCVSFIISLFGIFPSQT